MIRVYLAVAFMVIVGAVLLFYALNGLFNPVGKVVKREAERIAKEANKGDGE